MHTRTLVPILLAAAFLSSSCNGEVSACEDALAAQESCADEAGIDLNLDPEAFCEETERSEDYWDCFNDAFTDGDCDDEDGYNDAASDSEDCLLEED